MSETSESHSVIRASEIACVDTPVLVQPGSPISERKDTMAVVPLIEGDRVAGFEVRCQCGASIVVECVYEEDSP